jgi:hypothetical protein
LRAQADHWPLLKGTALSHHHTLPLRLSQTPSEGSEPPPRYSETPSDCSDTEAPSANTGGGHPRAPSANTGGGHPRAPSANTGGGHPRAAGGGRLERPSHPGEGLADLAEEEETDLGIATPAAAEGVRLEAVDKPSNDGAANACSTSRPECCRGCRCWLPRSAFSATQLKRRVAGERVCRACSMVQAETGLEEQLTTDHPDVQIEGEEGAAGPANQSGGGGVAASGHPDSCRACSMVQAETVEDQAGRKGELGEGAAEPAKQLGGGGGAEGERVSRACSMVQAETGVEEQLTTDHPGVQKKWRKGQRSLPMGRGAEAAQRVAAPICHEL